MHARAIRGFTSVSGASKVVKEIEIRWPSGIRQTLRNVPADQILTIEERAGAQ